MMKLYDDDINKLHFEIKFVYGKNGSQDFIECVFLVNGEIERNVPVEFDNNKIYSIEEGDDLKKEKYFGNLLYLSIQVYLKYIGKVAELGKPIECTSTNEVIEEFYKNLAVYIGTKK